MNEQLQQSVMTQLTNKKIVILGIGITGLSCARFLHRNQLEFSVNDSRAMPISPGDFKAQFDDNSLVIGHWDHALIASAEILLVSPGIDLATAEFASAINPQCDVIGDIELYCRLTDTPILAVTGSNGKSTVVSLLNYVGNDIGYRVQLGGNIGLPVLDQIDDKSADFIVLELSSFQLETIVSMNALAATVLNISDDHLDRHKTLAHYSTIKQGIYQHCKTAIYSRDDQATVPTRIEKSMQLVSFGSDQPKRGQLGLSTRDGQCFLMSGERALVALNTLPLQGMHNAMNYLAVLALGSAAGWSINDMLTSFLSFKGLAHRCELVASNDGIRWINDSKATNVGATLAAIEGLSSTLHAKQQLILIAGGDGKHADFSPLQPALTHCVDHLITLGADGDKIAQQRCQATSSNYRVKTLPEAVSLAKALANKDDLVLLSPACSSLDMFANYVERGIVFIKAIFDVKGTH